MKPYRFASLLFLFLNLVYFNSNAQAPVWKTAIGAPILDSTTFTFFNDLQTDPEGNVYIFSYLTGISKYSPQGTQLWSKNIPAQSFSKDAAGNTYLTGILSKDLVINNFTLTCDSFEVGVFIVKLDPAGNAVWAEKSQPKFRFGLNDGPSLSALKISTDSAGNSLIAGYTYGGVTFGSLTFAPSATNHATHFIVKYDPLGNPEWIHENQYPYPNGMALGPQNSYYIIGGKKLLKVSESGLLLWQKEFTVPSNSGNAQYNYLAVDKQGNCFVSGTTESAISVDSLTLKNSGTRNNFLVKYSDSGKLRWAKINQHLSDSSSSYGGALDVKSGQVYVTGTFYGTTTFDKRLPDLRTTLQMPQVFVAKISADNGMPYWMKQTTNANYAQGNALACLPNGEAFIAGFYHPAGCTFDNITLLNTPNSRENFFVAKLSASTALPLEPATDSEPETPIGCRFCPNPASSKVTINMPEFGTGDAIVYNTAGQKIYTGSLSEQGQLVIKVTDLAAGMYLVKLDLEGRTETQKLIVTH